MKKTILSVLLAAVFILTAALASCTEISTPTLFEQAKSDNGKFIETALDKTNTSMLEGSGFYKVLKSVFDKGTITLNANLDDSTALSGSVYIDGKDFATVFNAAGADGNQDVGIYHIGNVLTLNMEGLLGTGPISLSDETLKNIYEEAVGEASAESSLPVIDESVMEEFTSRVSDLVTGIIDGLEYTVSEEFVTVGGQPVNCVVTTYTLDTEDIKTMITSLCSGINTIMTDMGGGLSDSLLQTIESLFETYFNTGDEDYYSDYSYDDFYDDSYMSARSASGTKGIRFLMDEASSDITTDEEFDPSKIFDAEYIIGLLDDVGFTFDGTLKIAVSKDNNYLVYSSFEINMTADNSTAKLSGTIDLGANASIYDDKTITLSITADGESYTVSLVWDAENSADKLDVDAYIDVNLMKVFETKISYDRKTGDFKFDLYSDYMSDFSDDDYSSNPNPVFTAEGTLLYTDTAADLKVELITVEDETISNPLSLKFTAGCEMPVVPTATEITSSQQLCELLGCEDIQSLISGLFGGLMYDDSYEDYYDTSFSY